MKITLEFRDRSVKTELRQGSVLAPRLFLIVMDEIHKKVKDRLEEEDKTKTP